jgi:hypothetical protein
VQVKALCVGSRQGNGKVPDGLVPDVGDGYGEGRKPLIVLNCRSKGIGSVYAQGDTIDGRLFGRKIVAPGQEQGQADKRGGTQDPPDRI